MFLVRYETKQNWNIVPVFQLLTMQFVGNKVLKVHNRIILEAETQGLSFDFTFFFSFVFKDSRWLILIN
jgi:hypothetical protein